MRSPSEIIVCLEQKAIKYECLDLVNTILLDGRFKVWSASSLPRKHHHGTHGLIIHTFEVIELCELNNSYFGNKVNERNLFLAALFHDCGKMWDYNIDENGKWAAVAHKQNIHHISRSAIVWQLAATRVNYDWLNESVKDDITHAILAHHGLKEWGSPVSPNSHLAWMLHLCDGMSARIYENY